MATDKRLREFTAARIERAAAGFYPARARQPHRLVYYEEPGWEESIYFGFFEQGEHPLSPLACFVSSSWHCYARYNTRRSVADFVSVLAAGAYRPVGSEVLQRACDQAVAGRLPKLFEGVGEIEQAWQIHGEALLEEYFAATDRGLFHFFWQSTA